jgi:glucokinase
VIKRIFSADIGGTNSRFGHFQVDHKGKLSLLESIWLKTGSSSSFSHLLEQLRGSSFSLKPEQAEIAIIAIAGPVENGVFSSPPYISWDIDLTDLGRRFGFTRAHLINDFIAQAYATRSPAGKSAEQILSGTIDYSATVAVIGAGTALGKAALVPDGSGGFVAVASEGGHTNFPVESKEEFRFQEHLLSSLQERYLTVNMVVSGRGLSYIHQYLTGEWLDPVQITSELPPDSETLRWAARFYGRVCRNYALEILALGGVYIAGGVAAKLPEILKHKAFEDEFRDSSTMSSILAKIPVFLVANEESGLWGAALLGAQELLKTAK